MEGPTVALTELIEAVDNNAPNATLLIDPAGNTITFYKYKGHLLQSDAFEISEERIRRTFKFAVTRGSTMALSLKPEDDITEYITPNVLPVGAFQRDSLTEDDLDPFKEDRHDFLVVSGDFRLVFIIKTDEIPPCLQPFLHDGRLKIVRIQA